MELRHKILIVGDERFNINVLVDLLKPNYRVVAAIGGKQALKAARSDNPPDLILLDIRMPKLDGDEVCRQLMTDAATRDIPIIVVTAMGQTEDETGGLELGAVDDLTMPISAAVVEARVRSQLAVKKNLEDLRSANLVTEAQKERVQKELDAAREIQRAILTQEFPETDTICVRAELKTAREVGGDLYDVFELDPNRLCFCVGDVSGKGVGAALFMARTVTLIRSRAMNDPSPGSIVTHVNEVLEHDNDACMFVTLWLGILDLQTGVVTYTNGGHPPPYLCTLEGRVEALTARHGPVVAAVGGMVYQESQLQMDPADQLLLYTDGVTKARDPGDALYTEDRLECLLKETPATTADERLRTTIDDVWRYKADTEQSDDVTVLALQFFGVHAGAEAHTLELRLAGKLEEIDRCNQEFGAFSEAHGLPEKTRRSVNLVFDELLNNVISYGYDDDGANHEILVRVDLSSRELTIQVEDDGRPFNPFSSNTPDTSLGIEQRDIGGLGIHLIRELMDSRDYTRRMDRNVVTLRKQLRTS